MRTLAEWLTLQEAVHPKSIDLELTRVAAVARALGIEAPEFPVITVAGTNGKGSVVAHLEALFGALGASTGMFTSPHLLKYNERIRLKGREAADSELIAAFERIEAARGATTLTFFEYNTLAALVIFADRAVDVALLEVGLRRARAGTARAPAVGARRLHPVSQRRHGPRRRRGARARRRLAGGGPPSRRAPRAARGRCGERRAARGAAPRALPGGAGRGGVDPRYCAQPACGRGALETAARASDAGRRGRGRSEEHTS